MIRKISHNRSAFTLVEIMIVVAIIGLLAALALPAFAKARRQSMEKSFVEDIRIFEGGILTYAQTYGQYPADGPTGGLPVGMTPDDFKGTTWGTRTPMGGTWDYDANNAACGNCKAAITVIIATDANDPTWKEVDALIDDGDLTTGNFRIIRSDRYSYVIEQ